MRITKQSDDTFCLEFTDNDGYTHWVDPFKTYNEAYEWYRRYQNKTDDLK